MRINQGIGKKIMKKRKASLFEETKIQMVMKIFGMSRKKANEYIACKTSKDGQKMDDGSKRDYNTSSEDSDGMISAEEFFADED